MLRRLFGFGKKEEEKAPPPAAPTPSAPQWGAPTTPFLDYFALHLCDIPIDEAEMAVREHYLVQEMDTPGALLVQQGAWVSAYFPAKTVRGLGFNRQASFIAREQDGWVIGYRIYAGEGLDVHYFRGSEHLDQLAFSGEGIEAEPTSPDLFAELGDASSVLPRPATQHPLDFHFALLDALGIAEAALSWEMALERHEANLLGESRLLFSAPTTL